MLRRMKKISTALLTLFPLLISLLLTGAAPAHLPEVRAIWVTRFDYKKPADVEAIVAAPDSPIYFFRSAATVRFVIQARLNRGHLSLPAKTLQLPGGTPAGIR